MNIRRPPQLPAKYPPPPPPPPPCPFPFPFTTLQKLQMPRNLINKTLRARPNPQHRQAPRVNLRPPRIGNDLSRDPQAPRNPHQLHHLVLALDLHRNLLLPAPLPPPEEPRLGRVRGPLRRAREVLVAGEGCVGGLRGDLACWRRAVSKTDIFRERRAARKRGYRGI